MTFKICLLRSKNPFARIVARYRILVVSYGSGYKIPLRGTRTIRDTISPGTIRQQQHRAKHNNSTRIPRIILCLGADEGTVFYENYLDFTFKMVRDII
eukprot:scaffold380796_cov18-Prasinocladus_malaysianus.AAC.1